MTTTTVASATGKPDGSVGDINSTAKGSGARYNAGKAPFDLIPIRELVASLRRTSLNGPEVDALEYLSIWQEGGNVYHLHDALVTLGFDGWYDCAHVFDYGRAKYADWNWAKGMPWSVPLACAVRHLMSMLRGESADPESEWPHRGHVFCNISMLLTYSRTFLEGDDRPTMLATPEAA